MRLKQKARLRGRARGCPGRGVGAAHPLTSELYVARPGLLPTRPHGRTAKGLPGPPRTPDRTEQPAAPRSSLPLMAPPFTRLSKAVRNPLMPPARATSGGPSIPHVHSLLRGGVFPPTCPELASLVAPRCCDCLFRDPIPAIHRSACACPQPF